MCLCQEEFANIIPLITNYTSERGFTARAWIRETRSSEICRKDGRLMGDIKQLTRRPRQPDGQQLLQGALEGGRGQLLREDRGLRGSSTKENKTF